MLKKIKKRIGKDELLKGSILLFITISLFNLINYIFHFSMARLLEPADYRILVVLMSIVYIFNVPAEGLQTLISRYTSNFNIKNEKGKIKHLLIKSFKKATLLSIILFILYVPLSFFIGRFVNVDVKLVIFTGVLIFGIFVVPITRGIMQGRKKFNLLGFNLIIESSFKLVASIILVLLGFGVYGAVGGVVVGLFIAIIFSFIFIKEIVKSKVKKVKMGGVYFYGFYISMAVLTIMLMASLDIIFASRFFSPDIAGKYSVISMMGKIIFFGTIAVGKAMFPLVSEKHEKDGKTFSLLRKSLKLVVALILVSLLVYLFFPKLAIAILFGKKYIELSGILFLVGLSFSFLSITNLLVLYGLSTHKIKKSALFLIVFALLEIILFMIFRSSLTDFVMASLTANFLMLVYCVIILKK